MYIPGQIVVSQKDVDQFMALINDSRIKAEMSKKIRIEMDNERTKNLGSTQQKYAQSYESLTSGDVNTQARMAASGYDTYGRTIIAGNYNVTAINSFRKLKNKIKYGRSPQYGYENRGSYTIT